jgi:hypothetical protein
MTVPSTGMSVSVSDPSSVPRTDGGPRPCLNCGAALQEGGRFCASCGQRDIPAYPTVRELAEDAVTELWGWDGRLAATLRTLIFRPGQLTLAFLQGRRARYIAPIRLYLVASVAYFVLAAGAPDVQLESGKTIQFGLRFGVTGADTAGATSDPDPGGSRPLTAAQREQLLGEIEEAPSLMRPLLRSAMDDPDGLRRRVFETMPRIFFVLLPIFAVIVSMFYRGRRYPEHLYFAIHLHAFAFLALGLAELAKYTGAALLVGTIGVIALLWIPVYGTIALRAVYGGTVPMTLGKVVGIGAIYVVLAFIAFVATLFWISARV